ncbi:MAG: sigma-70 family RNA polymerase sigma factor [Planctomycetota bacterium]|nr:sigma-70 family RNA polymerase sigma factor [Planctomycetota bacterium]
MQALHRDATSWNGLCDLRPLVVGYLGRFLRDDAEIEDTAQETLLRAARFRLHLVDPARLRPWILRIALNVLRDRRRRESRLPRADTDEALLDGLEGREEIPGDSPPDAWIDLSGVVVERTAAYDHLDAAISCLDADDRSALSACYFGPPRSGAGADRVCETGRVRVPKHRVFRARRRLTRVLLQRFALDGELGWPVHDGHPLEPGSVTGAACARTGTRKRSDASAPRRAGG